MKLFEVLGRTSVLYRYRITDDNLMSMGVERNSDIFTGTDDLSEVISVYKPLQVYSSRHTIWTGNYTVICEGFESLEELKYMRPELFI
jgi:hypothetical protein